MENYGPAMTLSKNIIASSVQKLETYILQEEYRGYDPYDSLKSPLFSLPYLKDNKLVRWGAQQVMKRIPFNYRPLLGVKKGYNPVTLGLCLQSYCSLMSVFPEKRKHYQEAIDFCVEELERLQTPGYCGACWGYDFDWEARYAKIPAGTPTVVVIGFITNALFQHYLATGSQRSLHMCISASKVVRAHFHKTYCGETFCYSYSPLDSTVVFNATMKGARLLAQVYSVTGDAALLDEARQTVRFVVNRQKENGAWSYSEGDARTWVDNFHTGYVLDSLHSYITLSEDTEYEYNLSKGLQYYVNNFFDHNEIPKYYDNSTFPIDSTAAAQSIITLSRFGYKDLASKVAKWVVDNMQDSQGYFYYRKNRFRTSKISYMRWSNAWMLAALSFYMERYHDLV